GSTLSVQAKPSGRAAHDQDFSERSTIDVVAWRAMTLGSALMETHFVDAKRKVERAITHINGLEKWLWTINGENFEIACAHKKDAPERNLDNVWIKRPEGFSSPVGPMIGDALHNLRAALDAIAWMIVKAAGGTEEQLERLYFPLFPDAALANSADYKMISAAIPETGPIIADFVRGYKATR